MVETILFNLASKILGKIGLVAIREVGKAWGVEQELNTLSDTLSTIKAVLLDAERLYDHSKYSIAMGVWFDRLQAAFYDADNLVDEFQYEVLQRQVTRTFQRSQYDLHEELRNAQKERNGSRASRGPSDYYSSPFDGSANRQYWKQSWKTYGNLRSQF